MGTSSIENYPPAPVTGLASVSRDPTKLFGPISGEYNYLKNEDVSRHEIL